MFATILQLASVKLNYCIFVRPRPTKCCDALVTLADLHPVHCKVTWYVHPIFDDHIYCLFSCHLTAAVVSDLEFALHKYSAEPAAEPHPRPAPAAH